MKHLQMLHSFVIGTTRGRRIIFIAWILFIYFLEAFIVAGALVWSLHDITSTEGNSRFMWLSILLECV